MTEVAIKNKEFTIAELRKEASDLANEITSVNLKIKLANIDLDKIKEKVEIEKANLVYILEVQKNSNLEMANLSTHKKTITEEIDNLESKKPKLLKELDRYNSWISTAKDEYEKLVLKNKEYETKLSEKAKNVEIIFKLENEIKGLEEIRDLLRLENDGLRETGQKEINFQKEEISKIQLKIEELKKDAEYAEIKKRKIDDECSQRKRDLDIYYTRILEVWNKVFPGRNMPMIK